MVLKSMPEYWAFVPQVMEFAVDAADDSPVVLADREIARLGEKTFVDRLYAKWPEQDFEDRLRSEMLSSIPLVCLAAYRGTGKTSALRVATRRIRDDHPDVGTIIVDVKKLYDINVFAQLPAVAKPSDHSLELSYELFKLEIRNHIQAELFEGPDETLRLMAWCLAGAPDSTDPFNRMLVSEMLPVSDRALVEARAPGKRSERMKAIADLLRDDAKFLEYQKSVQPLIRTAHIVHAWKVLNRKRWIIIVFDNIDRIDLPYQRKFFEVVNDNHNALTGTCTSVIAIRRETLQQRIPRANEHGDVVRVVMPNDETYPCVLFPESRSEHVRAILERRHSYSIELYRTFARQPELETLHTILPIHDSVVDEFVQNSIHALANGSIRAMMKIYTGFTAYLYRIEQSGVARLDDLIKGKHERHLQTLFFLYLRDNAREHGLLFYDVVRSDVDALRAKTFAEFASVQHLLLAAILNLEHDLRLSPSNDTFPPFSQVAARLLHLGFSIEQIRDALQEMHAGPGEPPRTVEFVDGENDFTMVTSESSAKIRLMPLGRVIITELLDKVGYIWGQAYSRYQELYVPKRERQRSYHELSQTERVRIVLAYIRTLAANHLRLLCLLRDRWQKEHGPGWLEKYRADFAVGGFFQVERLTSSASSFYAHHFEGRDNPFRRLAAAYREGLQHVRENVSPQRLPVANLHRPRLEDVV